MTMCVAHPVGPARTFGKYESKAKTTAKSVLSSAETVRLMATSASDGNAIGPYVSGVVSEAEDAANKAQDTFDSIQPPDEKADHLRDQVDDVFSSTTDHITDVRVAARRGQLDTLAEVARPLDQDIEALKLLAGED